MAVGCTSSLRLTVAGTRHLISPELAGKDVILLLLLLLLKWSWSSFPRGALYDVAFKGISNAHTVHRAIVRAVKEYVTGLSSACAGQDSCGLQAEYVCSLTADLIPVHPRTKLTCSVIRHVLTGCNMHISVSMAQTNWSSFANKGIPLPGAMQELIALKMLHACDCLLPIQRHWVQAMCLLNWRW